MVRAVVLASVLAGCGRLAFDERSVRSDGGPDAKPADAEPDGVLTPGVIQRWQQGPVVNTAGPSTISLDTPSMPGSLLVLALAVNDPSSLVLPGGWTTAATTGNNGACTVLLAYMPNAPITTSMSFTMSGGAPNVAQLIEITGASPTAPLDVVGQFAANNGQTVQTVSTSAATTASREIAVTVYCEDANMPTYTPDPLWMRVGTFVNSSATPSFEADYTIVSPSIASETVTSSLSGKYAAVIAAFK